MVLFPINSTTASPIQSGPVAIIESKVAEEAVKALVKQPASSKIGKRRDRGFKPKLKPKKTQIAKCVGFYVDALDKKLMWGEARIIQCNLDSHKIKVHFVGWSKNYDLWTDPISITAHGRYARSTNKSEKSWDGDMRLFDDVLGTIVEANFNPVPAPTHSEPQSASVSGLKRMASTSKVTLGEKGAQSLRLPNEFQKKKSHSKSKNHVTSIENANLKKNAIASKAAGSKKHGVDSLRGTNGLVGGATNKENAQVKRDPFRKLKSRKREAEESVPTNDFETHSFNKVRAYSFNQLPLIRDLELDDGTVLDFSEQREKARVQREAMQSFLSKCALLWKQQLSV
ncbi:uncharacterized protein CCR75_007276 [Bremia lactucae]|uniref:Tudor-knot domain-containing protein n=1 Tax=Bremia lactucae TaxID=4779 RepID=A0A976FES2_BRELC|nr:hypothetical protein CCR75_007276 [Bremia lactucae]